MSKEDCLAILYICSLCVYVGTWIDREFFAEERMLNSIVDDAKKNHKCPICFRPMKITEDEK